MERNQVQEHVDRAREQKEVGNTCLKGGKYKQASFEYKKGLMFVTEYLPKDLKVNNAPEMAMFGGGKQQVATKEEAKAALELCVQLNGNIAQARLKLGDWDGTLKHTNEILRLDPTNVKAHFRRGTAYLRKGDTDRARADFDLVHSKDPESVKSQLDLLEKEEAKQKKAQDKLYKKMFT
eukprot:TRINITY_DN3962_c0_g1_i1.p1 TRINITY_DN3962_c0_g1~~TRINITY_DN3962_c0_g1_i1.p1  ORF type:complete len:202 (+),score=59.69 TRINITY_DN3962_c0_g1_i1:72-608(+)